MRNFRLEDAVDQKPASEFSLKNEEDAVQYEAASQEPEVSEFEGNFWEIPLNPALPREPPRDTDETGEVVMVCKDHTCKEANGVSEWNLNTCCSKCNLEIHPELSINLGARSMPKEPEQADGSILSRLGRLWPSELAMPETISRPTSETEAGLLCAHHDAVQTLQEWMGIFGKVISGDTSVSVQDLGLSKRQTCALSGKKLEEPGIISADCGRTIMRHYFVNLQHGTFPSVGAFVHWMTRLFTTLEYPGMGKDYNGTSVADLRLAMCDDLFGL